MDKLKNIFIFLILFQTSEASKLYIDDDSLLVGFKCGRADVYKDGEEWMEVEGGVDGKNCLKAPVDVLDLCKHVYPLKSIVNVAQMNYQVSISHWCLKDDKACLEHVENSAEEENGWDDFFKVTVTPWKCLNSSYENRALPVPEDCRFDHLSDSKMCAPSTQYINQARQRCEEMSMNLKQQSPLKSCGLDKFVGIEFVCCPDSHYNKNKDAPNNNAPNNNNNHHNKNNHHNNKADNDFSGTNNNHNEQDHHQNHNFITDNHYSTHHNNHHNNHHHNHNDSADKASDDSDITIDYNHPNHHNKHPSSSHHTHPVFESHQSPPIRGSNVIDGYLRDRKRGWWSEHGLFGRAKLQLAAVHKRRLQKLERSWREAQERASHHGNQNDVHKLKATINERFQKMMEAEDVEHSVERLQLGHLHEQEARKRLDSMLQHSLNLFLHSIDLPETHNKPHQVLLNLEKYVKNLHKDRLHTILHYNHTEPTYAETIRQESAGHIASLDRKLSQALTMLDQLDAHSTNYVLKRVSHSLHSYHALDASFMVKVVDDSGDSEDFNVVRKDEGVSDGGSDGGSVDDDDGGRRVKSGDSVEETPRVMEEKGQRGENERNGGGALESDHSDENEDEDEDDGSEDDGEWEDDEGDWEEEDEGSDDSLEVEEGGEEDDRSSSVDDDEDEDDDRNDDSAVNNSADDDEEEDSEDEEEEEEEEEEDSEDDDDDEENYEKEEDDFSEDAEDVSDDNDDVVKDDYNDDASADDDDVSRDGDGGKVHKDYWESKADSFKKSAMSMEQKNFRSSKQFPTPKTNFGTAIPLGVTVGTLTVAVVIIVGVLVMHRRGKGVYSRGVVSRNEQDSLQSTPEEKHMASMQVNGYENPTYKYFERTQSTPPIEA